MTVGSRWRGAVILGGALVVIVLMANLIGIILSVTLTAVGGYFLLRPPSPELYVETTEKTLIIKVLATNRIALRDVRSAELWRPDYPALVRGFLNFFLVLGNFFGSRWDLMKADAPTRDVMVRFRRWVWVFMPLPPFVIPKRNWVLMVEDAELLRDDLIKRLGLPAREVGTLDVEEQASAAPTEALRVADEGERPTILPESLRTEVQKGRLLEDSQRRELRFELARLVREGVLETDRIAQMLEAEGWGADAAFDFAESVVREAFDRG